MTHWLRWFLLCTAAGLSLALDQAPAAESPVSPVQHLFLIDTSLPLARHKSEIGRAIGTRIASGLEGQFHTSDIFALWTFDEAVVTNRYLPMVWIPAAAEALSGHLVRTWEEQVFRGDARLDRALAEALKLAETTESLTILIISDGTARLRGTPFDARINATLVNAIATNASAEAIFVTSLLARRGQLVAWSVSTASGASLPPAPEEMLHAALPHPSLTRELGLSPPASPAGSDATGETNQAKEPTPAFVPAQIQPTASLPAELAAPKAELAKPDAPVSLPESAKAPASILPAGPASASEATPEEPLPAAIVETVRTASRLSGTKEEPWSGSKPPIVRQAAEVDPRSTAKASAAGVPVQTPAEPMSTHQAASANAPPPAGVSATVPPPIRTAANPAGSRNRAAAFLAIGIVLFLAASSTLIYLARAHRAPRQPSLISRSLDPGERRPGATPAHESSRSQGPAPDKDSGTSEAAADPRRPGVIEIPSAGAHCEASAVAGAPDEALRPSTDAAPYCL